MFISDLEYLLKQVKALEALNRELDAIELLLERSSNESAILGRKIEKMKNDGFETEIEDKQLDELLSRIEKTSDRKDKTKEKIIFTKSALATVGFIVAADNSITSTSERFYLEA